MFVVPAIAMPVIATAQPGMPSPPPPPAPDGGGIGSGSDAANTGSGTTTGADDTKIRELVDHELAKILADRATKEAAERAAKEAEQPASPVNQPAGDITGSSGFFDTRVAFTLTDENMLVQPGQTIPSVPGLHFGVPNSLGTLFFDNYDTRYSGFETLSHAVMYRNFHRGHFDAEAAIVLRL